MAKYVWYIVNSYLALLALLHATLWVFLYPYCVKLMASLALLPWDATSVQDEKLVSIIEYLSICLLTPLFTLLLLHWQKHLRRLLSGVPYPLLVLLTLWSVGSLLLSQHLAKSQLLTLLVFVMSLLCLCANAFSRRIMTYLNKSKVVVHEQ